jgi:hypothetical protein
MEPTSLQAVTDRALALLARTPHRISYFHCPVPLSAMPFLASYLAPLSQLYPALVKHGCELVLGLVHAQDLNGTRERIKEARKLAPTSAVATECGMGRTPQDQVADLMAISALVAGRVDGLADQNGSTCCDQSEGCLGEANGISAMLQAG